MRITESKLRRIIREALVKPSDLDDQQLERLSQLLDDADLHPEFAGYDLVKGSEKDQLRLAILNDKEVVGFMTPRFDRGYWRTGAIYADPAMRGGGHMRRAIIEFFSNPSHRPARVWIGEDNIGSQRAFLGAGFKRGGRRDIGDGPGDKGHDYYLE